MQNIHRQVLHNLFQDIVLEMAPYLLNIDVYHQIRKFGKDHMEELDRLISISPQVEITNYLLFELIMWNYMQGQCLRLCKLW